MQTLPLKYLFSVQFKDGTTYRQNPDDLSSIKPGGSSFSDVVNRLHEVEVFTLSEQPVNHDEIWTERSYAVDLIDGHFAVNGDAPFFIHDNPHLYDFKLIYFRRRRVHQTIQCRVGEQLQVEIDSVACQDGGTEYHFGWQAQVPGGKVLTEKRIMVLL